MKFHDLPFLIAIPGVVPPAAHIQIESVFHLIGTQAFHEELVRHNLLRFDDASGKTHYNFSKSLRR